MVAPAPEDRPDLPAPFPAAATEISLRILSLTDLHMEIRPHDYYTDTPKPGGLARAATVIDRLKSASANSLLFDNGDILQGNLMGDFAARLHASGDRTLHPMIAALNHLGLDAATIGNHEFNYGLDLLNDAIASAGFPVVSANVARKLGRTPPDDDTLVPPYIILNRTFQDGAGTSQSIRIGVIGLLPPQISRWDEKHVAGKLFTRGIVETARAYLPVMQAEGTDLIVALSHSGIDNAEDHPRLENASLHLAALPGIDAVIAGHDHNVFPSAAFSDRPHVNVNTGTLHGKPANMGGFGSSHIGVIDLLLARSGNRWRVERSRGAAVKVPKDSLPPGDTETAILAATDAAHKGTLAYIRRPVGATAVPLHTYFAMLEPSAAVCFVAKAQAAHLESAVRGSEFDGLPLLSAAAPFKVGGRGGPEHFTDIPRGAMAIRHVADLYGFPNLLRAVLVSGAELRNWLEHAAGYFRRIAPDQKDQPLVNPEFPSYNFDTITGLSYRIDLTQPARFSETGTLIDPTAQRVRGLRYNGETITASWRGVVATNDFRASRSGTYPGADQATSIPIAPASLRDILTQHVQASPPDRAMAAPPWALSPIKDASVLFETGPGAETHTTDQDRLGLENVGLTEDGFLRFRKRW